MFFEDSGFESVHLQITTDGKTRNPCSYYVYFHDAVAYCLNEGAKVGFIDIRKTTKALRAVRGIKFFYGIKSF